MRIVVLLAGCFMLAGCNALFGVPETSDEQPWRTVYLIALSAICMVPVISLSTLIAVRITRPAFIRRSQSLFVFSVGMFMLLLCAWLVLELSLPKHANIRIDLFIVIPAAALQAILIALSGYFYGHSHKDAA